MSTNKKYFLNIIALIILTLVTVQCTKENFTEPIDPFEIQRLDPNPEIYTLGKGENALTLKANESSIFETKNGKRIKGSLYIANETYGDIRLSNGDFELIEDTSLAKGNDNGLYFIGFRGEAIINLPKEGLLQNIEIPGLTAAPIGFKKGSELEDWPLNEDRYYFYYENLNPLPVNITSSSLENITKIAIDPSDPYFFVMGDINGTPLGDISDAGIAISAQGLIPFTPKASISEFKMDSFYGNLYITGNVPIGKYPASFTGETVLSFSSKNNEDSDLFFAGKSADFILGLNGTVLFTHDAFDWMGIDVELGNATLQYSMKKSGNTNLRFIAKREDPKVSDFVKDVVGKDYKFLDYLSPYETEMAFYGSIGNDLADWQMGFKIRTKFKIPKKNGNYNIDMGHSYIQVSSKRIYYWGEAVLAGFSRIGVKGKINLENGNFKLTGYSKQSFSADAGKLKIGYSLAMDVTLENYNKVVSFEAKVKLKGKACWGKLCARITIKANVKISSNGNYRICFSVGIGKIGFDVCIKKTTLANGQFEEIMTYDEIPLEFVPVQNRFEAYECD